MLGFVGHKSLFIGRDPFEIERHAQLLDNLQFHYGRMWPLEVALWDLMGKISGPSVEVVGRTQPKGTALRFNQRTPPDRGPGRVGPTVQSRRM